MSNSTHDIEKLIAEARSGPRSINNPDDLLLYHLANRLEFQTAKVRELEREISRLTEGWNNEYTKHTATNDAKINLEAIVERVRMQMALARDIVEKFYAGSNNLSSHECLETVRALLVPRETAVCVAYPDRMRRATAEPIASGQIKPDQPPPAQARDRLKYELAQFGGAVANYASGNYPLGKGFAIVEEHAERVASTLCRNTDHDHPTPPAQTRERARVVEALQAHLSMHRADAEHLLLAFEGYFAAREGK